MKLLIIDGHKPEYFFNQVAERLRSRGHVVDVLPGLPADCAFYDAVLNIYLSRGLADITSAVSPNMNLYAFSMGTDAVTSAWTGTNWNKVRKIFVVNKHHEQFLHKTAPETMLKTELVGWYVQDDRLKVVERQVPNNTEPIRLLNIALHTHMKGLDNLIQMLMSLPDESLRRRVELHVVGDIYDPYLSFFCAFLRENADFTIVSHGNIPPHSLDGVVNSIQPHAYIAASQGEASGTTIMEALYKGIPAIVQEHPFTISPNTALGGKIVDGFFDQDVPISWYLTVTQLQDAIQKLSNPDSFNSRQAHEYAKQWELDRFCDRLLKGIQQ